MAALAESPSADQPSTLRLDPQGIGSRAPSIIGGALGWFAEYELLEEIARGGMGVVYKARQHGLDRIVAVKMILEGRFAGPEEVQRFRVEAAAAAQLQHPHIVAIYEVGEQNGQHFFSMEYVPGLSLSKRLSYGVLPGMEAARYLEQIARGLHYAHSKGILHRDIKPANILIDEKDLPKLTDFGLAKMTGSAACRKEEITRTGAVMGTPSYMAPEQAGGSVRDIGPGCDVYGLGAVLYELITGRPPFKGESPLDTVLQVINEEPVPPRLINRNVDSDLEAVCLKCLNKDPALRYRSAADLADDLRRYQDGESVSAGSINLLERITRTLTHSQHDKHVSQWGVGLMLFGLIIGLMHVTMSLMLLTEAFPTWLCKWGPRGVQFTALGLLLWYWRPQSMLPTNSAERLIYAVWLGYILAYSSMARVFAMLGLDDYLATYGAATAITGFAFFVMGAHVWGGCYLVGLGFWIAAPFMAIYAESIWSPTWFGLLWATALGIVGLRYWLRGQPVKT